MKSNIIVFLKDNPFFLNIAALLHNLFMFSTVFNFSRTNKIITKGVFLKKTKFKISGKNNFVHIHPECRLNNCLIFISGNNCKVIIGEHCNIKTSEFWIEDNSGLISIGEQTTIEGAHIAATEGKSISVGEDCMFSSNIQIRNGDSHSIYDNKTGLRINHARPVSIGNHVWLGNSVTILKGSTVADNSIVATGSIVVGDCLDINSIYGGIPVRKMKDNILWERHR